MYIFWKKIIDIFVAVIMLLIFLPFWFVTALVIWLTDGPPVLFGGNRIGKQCKIFKTWKFRTLPTACRPLVQGLADTNPYNDFAGFLRATHLDEIPQYLNVLCGKMSLIGPRPLQLERYQYLVQREKDWQIVTRIRPGITGLNQIIFYCPQILDLARSLPGLGRSTERRRLELDAYYIQHVSPGLDAKIAWWTTRYLVRNLMSSLVGNLKRHLGTGSIKNSDD